MGKAIKGASGGGSEEEIVLAYLEQQNRPYNAGNFGSDAINGLVDVFNNLHGTVGRTSVAKVLQTLADQGAILGKPYGKTVVYCARQVGRGSPLLTD